MELLPLHMPQAKRCNTCTHFIDRDYFGTDKYRPDGKSDRCLACRRAYAATHTEEKHASYLVRYARDKDKIQAQQAGYYRLHKEALAPKRAKWQKEHRPELRAKATLARQANPEKARLRDRTFVANHPGYSTAKWRRRWVLIRGAGYSDLSEAQFAEMCAAQKHRCYYCGKRCKDQLTRDHIIPVSQGGADTITNIVAVCRSCNSSKGKGEPPVAVQLTLLTEAPPKKRKVRKPKPVQEETT